MTVWYLAHPVVGDVLANLARAKRWLRWLMDHEPDVAFCCPWLPMVEVADDSIPKNRERGLRDDVEMAIRCDGIVLVGGRVSSGMKRELDAMCEAGCAVSDLTHLGDEPPASGFCEREPIAIGRFKWEAP